MNERIKARLGDIAIQDKTFHALALQIIHQDNHRVLAISKLETDSKARHALLIAYWQRQRTKTKVQSKGWRQWLIEDLDWELCRKAISGKISVLLNAWLAGPNVLARADVHA